MASITSNRTVYDDPGTWNRGGDSWTFHAQACGQDYDIWKRSVVDYLLDPFLGPDVDVLELGPGYGRWSEFMVDHSRSLSLVDVSARCIEACRFRFAGQLPDAAFVVNDGRSIPAADASVDLVWSFATFVHIDEPEVDAYLSECRRVLRPGGRFVIHHAGWSDWSLTFLPLTRPFGRPGHFVQHRLLAAGRWTRVGGRAPMSAARFAKMAADHGLAVDRQLDRWGDNDQFAVAYRDVITIGTRGEGPETVAANVRRL
jgi:SAM-dependent methyltransferase